MMILNNLYQYDLRILLWCGKSRCYLKFMQSVRLISRSGDGYLQLALPLSLLIFLPEHGKNFCLLAAFAFTIERPLYFILKCSLKRRRPPEIVPCFTSVVTPSDRFSFPSGHTMAAFTLAGLCYCSFGAIAIPFYLWATAVGTSRVLLGVHFPSDIIAGATIGTLIVNYSMRFMENNGFMLLTISS